jgi:hypothetical protein
VMKFRFLQEPYLTLVRFAKRHRRLPLPASIHPDGYDVSCFIEASCDWG